MNLKHTLLPFATLAMQLANAQLVVDNTLTPTALVQDLLLGTGITASNVQFNDLDGTEVNEQIGAFSEGISAVGWPQGLIIATGDVLVALGPNDAGGASLGGGNFGADDLDLEVLSGVPTNDRAVLEMDFVSDGNGVQLLFAFASEEYPEFACSPVNDVLGIFLSGPGITGPFTNDAINLAVLPGGNVPVAINSVNPGVAGSSGTASNCAAIDPNWQANSIYYLENGDPASMQFDGRTVGLIAFGELQAGLSYHLKIAVADGADTAYDSALFLAANSFTSDLTTAVPAIPGAAAARLAMMDGGLAVENLPTGVDAMLVVDGMGRVLSRHPVEGSTERALIPLQGAAAGLYLLHLNGSNGFQQVLKFVIGEGR